MQWQREASGPSRDNGVNAYGILRVGLLSYTAKETVEKSTYPVTVLYVPDLDPVATRFNDAKYPIRLLSGPTSGARIAMATDPSGNTVEVVERPGAAAVGGAKLIVDDRAKAEAFLFGSLMRRRHGDTRQRPMTK